MAENGARGQQDSPTPGAKGPGQLPGPLDWRGVLPLAVAIALGMGAILVLPYLRKPLELLVVAITAAEALTPLVELLARRTRRSLAIAIVYVLLLALAAVIAWLVIPPLIRQGQALIQRTPEFLTQVQQYVNRWDRLTGGNLAGLLASLPGRIGNALVRVPVELATAVFDTLLIVFLSVYWLAGAPHITGFLLSLINAKRRPRAALVLHEMGRNMGGYVRATVINAAIMGLLSWVGLTLIGVPYAVVLGVLTMVGEMVPIVGPVVVGVIVAGLALMRSLGLAIAAVLLYTALIQLEGHILTPNIMARQTSVPQTLVLFAIVVGAAGGLLGIIVSVPIAAALRVFVLEVLAPMERRAAGVVSGPPAPPTRTG